MGTIFDSKTNIFKKNKPLMTDGCCDEALPCCESGTGARGYKIFFGDGGTPQEINDGSTFLETINVNTKWSIYLETLTGLGSVTVSSIVIPSIPAGLSVATTPFTIPEPGNDAICNANWATTGTRTFSVSVTTDSGNISFNVEIKVL